MAEDSIDLDEVSLLGQSVPIGTYIVKAVDFEAGETRTGKPKVQVTFDILEGDFVGMTLQKNYYLGTFIYKKGPNKGKAGSMGVTEAKTDAHNVGVLDKLASPFPLDADKARKALHKAFNGVRMKAVKSLRDGKPDDIDEETGKVKQYPTVSLFAAGIAKQGAAAPEYA